MTERPDHRPAPATTPGAGRTSHRLTIETHMQAAPARLQALVTCSCGWATWNVTTNGAELDGLDHRRAAAQDTTRTRPTDPRSHPQDVRT